MLGDELVAVAGMRVRTGDDAIARLGERPPGERVELAVFRGARLELRSLTLAPDPHRSFRFELAPDAALSPQTLGLRRAWLQIGRYPGRRPVITTPPKKAPGAPQIAPQRPAASW
jgi:predicted metalloprotease with PDZ domain